MSNEILCLRICQLAVSPICSFDAYHLKTDREYLFRVTPRNKYGWGDIEMTPRPVRVGRTVEQPVLPRSLPRQVRAMPGGSISLDAQVTNTTQHNWNFIIDKLIISTLE